MDRWSLSDTRIREPSSSPTPSFLEGWGRDRSGGYHTNDNYGIQLGVVLPLFSWLSKDQEIVETRIQSQYTVLAANKRHIANEVAEAFGAFQDAARSRSRSDAARARANRKLEAMADRLAGSEDPLAVERLRYDLESERDDFKKYILAADRRYNQAILRLEEALGADLDQVFNVKFESVAGARPDQGEVLASAAAQSTKYPDIPRAYPVPKVIELPSQKQDPATPEQGRGLFRSLKRAFSKSAAEIEKSAPKKEFRRGITNRHR